MEERRKQRKREEERKKERLGALHHHRRCSCERKDQLPEDHVPPSPEITSTTAVPSMSYVKQVREMSSWR